MKPQTKSTATASSLPAAKSRNRAISPASIDGAIKGPMPDFIEPCLATLVAAPPQGDDWVHEIKFDGYRIQVRIDGDGVKLITRSGLDWTDRFGALPLLLRKVHQGTALIDSELVVEDKEGHSSFTELATALKSGRAQGFVLQCFDLLYLDGFNITQATLLERKKLLRQMLGRRGATSQIRYSEHLSGDSAGMLQEACRLGLEGVVSKRVDRPYRSGRHDEWLKSKCIQVDEFIIIGYLASNVSASAIGAIVVGYFDRRRLIYAGRVGTGFTQRTAAELMRSLKPLRIADPIVATQLTGPQRKGVTWVKPVVVAQIEYRAWTADNLLRHAAFKGLREDKPATEVRRPTIKT